MYTYHIGIIPSASRLYSNARYTGFPKTGRYRLRDELRPVAAAIRLTFLNDLIQGVIPISILWAKK